MSAVYIKKRFDWKEEEQRLKAERLEEAKNTIEKLRGLREQEKERVKDESEQVTAERDDLAHLEGVGCFLLWINFKEDAWKAVMKHIDLKENEVGKAKNNSAMKRALLNIMRKHNGEDLEF